MKQRLQRPSIFAVWPYTLPKAMWIISANQRAKLVAGVLALLAAALAPTDVMAQATPPKQNVFEVPPPRAKPAMTPDERSKLKNDLGAIRDRQAGSVKGKAAGTRKP
jgi:hypothetical protein